MSSSPAKKSDFFEWQKNCGPLEAFLKDPSINEIMVNGAFKIYVEQKGILKKTGAKFSSEQELVDLMKRICVAAGKTLDPQQPLVDLILPDGSRVNCVLPPISVDGPSLTIRRFSSQISNYKQLIEQGTLDERLAYFLSTCVLAKLNIIVSGGTSSGKTTLLNVLSSFIPAHERIITIEDAPELKIANENTVRLESRMGNSQESPITIRQLVSNALRMRPDRIIIGECRGAESIDMLSAMNTGHEGSMTTIHANSAREALRRLESMIMFSGGELPLKAVRQHISSALNLIIQVSRDAQGKRRIMEVIEVGGMESETILTQDIFRFDPAKGFQCMGFVPQFVSIFKKRGVNFPPDFFTDSYQVRGS